MKFIRALWGDEHVQRREKAKRDVVIAMGREHQVPHRVYCYGRGNHSWLASLGIASTLVSVTGIVNFSGLANRNARGNRRGEGPWGVSMWYHKIEVMYAAACEYGEIVWIDWDVQVCEPLPADFWDKMRHGQRIQGAVQRLKRPTCRARFKIPDGPQTRQGNMGHVTHGAFVYIRGVETVQRIRELAKQSPTLVDQAIFSEAIDELTCGWKGESWLRRNGFVPYGYKCRNQVGGPPSEMLFRTSR